MNCAKEKKRDLNVEVLRCFLMLVIVVYHGCNNGPFDVAGQCRDVKFGSWILFWATNAFAFISGWYGIRMSSMRLFKFLGLGLFASIVHLLFSPFVLGKWTYSYTLGWFGNSYLAIMLVAPLVNAALSSVSASGNKNLLITWGLYSLAMALSWIPLRFLGVSLSVPGWGGHTFNTMLYIYVSAYCLKRCGFEKWMTRHWAMMIFGAAISCHVLNLGLVVLCRTWKEYFSEAGDYNSPAMLVAGAMIFVVFLKTRFPVWLQKLCGYIAPSMFSVYLLHTAVGPVCKVIRDQSILSFDAGFYYPCHRVVSVVTVSMIIFSGCVAIDVLRRISANFCRRLWR